MTSAASAASPQSAITITQVREEWQPFGMNITLVNADEESPHQENAGTVHQKEFPFVFGDYDAEEKEARAEIMKELGALRNAEVSLMDPAMRKLQNDRAEEIKQKQLLQQKMEEERKKHQTTTETRTNTWGVKEQNKNPEYIVRIDEKTNKKIRVIANKIRVMGIGTITNTEMNRLFGPDNGLERPRIQFLYTKDENGNETRRDFCYITYGSKEVAAQAIKRMNNVRFKHVVLHVDYSAA